MAAAAVTAVGADMFKRVSYAFFIARERKVEAAQAIASLMWRGRQSDISLAHAMLNLVNEKVSERAKDIYDRWLREDEGMSDADMLDDITIAQDTPAPQPIKRRTTRNKHERASLDAVEQGGR